MSKIDTALASLGDQVRDAFLAHVRGGTSAAWLADWLTRAGHPVGATTVKEFRKKVRHAAI